MKKQLLLFLFTFLPLMASADESGTCGENLTWTYEEATKTLTISGNGEMYDYDSWNNFYSPWYSYKNILQHVIVTSGVTSIGKYAFEGCSDLTSLTIPNSVTSIGESAFNGCSGLTSLTIPNSVTSIGVNAFSGCNNLNTVHISDIKSWCNISFADKYSNPFYYAKHAYMNGEEIKELIIPNSMTTIKEAAFYNWSGLTSIVFPENLTIIKKEAFKGCSGLINITIPASVEFIYQEAFAGCSSLQSINAQPTTPPFLYNNSFSDFSVPLNVPNGCVDAYKAAQGWSNFTNISDGNLYYQMTVTAGKNGTVTYNSQNVTDVSKVFDVKEGNNAVLTITPATGYQVATLTVNGNNAMSQLSNGTLTISNVTSNTTVAATFELAQGYAETIKMTVPNGDRTAIGYSSAVGLDFTGIEDIKAWIVSGFADDATVLLSRVRIVPPNTGLYLTSNVAGIEVNVPTTDRDIYYANLLKAAVTEETIQPTEIIDGVEFTNFVVGKLTSGEMGFERVKASRTLGPNKSRLLVPSSYYSAGSPAPSLRVEFIDENATDIKDINSMRQNIDDGLYDLQGRKLPVNQAKKGIYIYKGKKFIVK